MRQKKYRKPQGYQPPRGIPELVERYRTGERFFEDAELQGAQFLNAPPLENVNLTGADLSGAYAKYASFVGVDFSETICAGMNFEHARLYRCSFARADLRGAWMYCTQIAFVSFFAAKMKDVHYVETIVARSPDEAMLASGRMKARSQAASCFVSYSSRDRFPGDVARALHDASIPNWFMPQSSHFDSYIAENLTRAIAMCDVFALVLSANALASRWVKEEVRSALRLRADKGKPRVVVLRVDETAIPDEKPFSALSDPEYIDCQDGAQGVKTLIDLLTESTS